MQEKRAGWRWLSRFTVFALGRIIFFWVEGEKTDKDFIVIEQDSPLLWFLIIQETLITETAYVLSMLRSWFFSKSQKDYYNFQDDKIDGFVPSRP